MDFGKGSLIKRAKQIDKKLDEIVKNPYKVDESKTIQKRNKKPLIFVLSGAVACLAIGVVTFAVTRSFLKGPISTKSNGKSNYYSGKKPDFGDLTNYVSNGFGFSEYTFFSLCKAANEVEKQNLDQSLMGLKNYDGDFEKEDEEGEDTYQSHLIFDDQGRLHYPIEIKPEYTFDNFFYFEFNNEGCNFLDERIGTGKIQALTVHSDIYNEYILVLKNNNRYYSCLTNGGSYCPAGPVSLRFSTHKYIEEWDLIKDDSLVMKIEMCFRENAGYLGGETISFGETTFPLDNESFYYVRSSFTMAVNDVRAFIGLEPDERFGKEFVPIKIKNPVEISVDEDTFMMEEFGDKTFTKTSINQGDGAQLAYYFDGNFVVLKDSFFKDNHNAIFLADLNYDGYREIVYLTKNSFDCYTISAIDVHNDIVLEEINKQRGFDIWFKIVNNSLKCYAYQADTNNNETIYDYADIVTYETNAYRVGLIWQNFYQNEKIIIEELKDSLNGENIFQRLACDHRLVKNQIYYITIAIYYRNDCPFIDGLDPFETAFSAVTFKGQEREMHKLDLMLVSVNDNYKLTRYTFSFEPREEGSYVYQFMFDNSIEFFTGTVFAE